MIETLIVKLTRDQSRAVQETFFPYMGMLCESNIRDVGGEENQLLNSRAVHSLFLSVKRQFDSKLQSQAKSIEFKFTYAEALSFYTLLDNLPINNTQVWLNNLRSLVADTLYKQLCEP